MTQSTPKRPSKAEREAWLIEHQDKLPKVKDLARRFEVEQSTIKTHLGELGIPLSKAGQGKGGAAGTSVAGAGATVDAAQAVRAASSVGNHVAPTHLPEAQDTAKEKEFACLHAMGNSAEQLVVSVELLDDEWNKDEKDDLAPITDAVFIVINNGRSAARQVGFTHSSQLHSPRDRSDHEKLASSKLLYVQESLDDYTDDLLLAYNDYENEAIGEVAFSNVVADTIDGAIHNAGRMLAARDILLASQFEPSAAQMEELADGRLHLAAAVGHLNSVYRRYGEDDFEDEDEMWDAVLESIHVARLAAGACARQANGQYAERTMLGAWDQPESASTKLQQVTTNLSEASQFLEEVYDSYGEPGSDSEDLSYAVIGMLNAARDGLSVMENVHGALAVAEMRHRNY